MIIPFFGIVIRTRRSLRLKIIEAIKAGRTDTEVFKWALNVYNTGIFGLLIYRTNDRCKGLKWFIEQSNKDNE